MKYPEQVALLTEAMTCPVHKAITATCHIRWKRQLAIERKELFLMIFPTNEENIGEFHPFRVDVSLQFVAFEDSARFFCFG